MIRIRGVNHSALTVPVIRIRGVNLHRRALCVSCTQQLPPIKLLKVREEEHDESRDRGPLILKTIEQRINERSSKSDGKADLAAVKDEPSSSSTDPR